MPNKGKQFHVAFMAEGWPWYKNAVGAVLMVLFFPLILVLVAIGKVFEAFSAPTYYSIDEVIQYIEDFLGDTGGEWDWDDFTSLGANNEDPILHKAWEECNDINLPPEEEDLDKLEAVLSSLKEERRNRNKPFPEQVM